MVTTWRLDTRLVKNSYFKGLTSLDSFLTKNVNFEMECRVSGTCYVDDPYVILKSKTGTIKIIRKCGHMSFSTRARAGKCWNSGN